MQKTSRVLAVVHWWDKVSLKNEKTLEYVFSNIYKFIFPLRIYQNWPQQKISNETEEN